jgi:hypothetical protein
VGRLLVLAAISAGLIGLFGISKAGYLCFPRYGQDELRLSLVDLGWQALSSDNRSRVNSTEIRQLRLPYAAHAYDYHKLSRLLPASKDPAPWQATKVEDVVGARLMGACENFVWVVTGVEPTGEPFVAGQVVGRVVLGNPAGRGGLFSARIVDGPRAGDRVTLSLPPSRFVAETELCVAYDEQTDRVDDIETGHLYFQASICR